MSQKDRLDWNEELDFESLADEHDGIGGLDGPFADTGDFDDLSYEETSSRGRRKADVPPAPPVAAAPEAPQAAKPEKPRKPLPKVKRGMPAAVLSLILVASTLAAGAGLGGAILLISEIDPATLWDPAALLRLDPWLNLQENPLNLLYLVGAGIVTVILLGLWSVGRAAAAVNGRIRRSETLLDTLTRLRLDDEVAWQQAALKTDPAVEAFAAEILGAYRLQKTRKEKTAGLEGELRRLEAAVSNQSRQDLQSGYDHPLIGSLADESLRLLDEREAAGREADALRAKDRGSAQAVLNGIQEARGWNRATLDQIGLQGAAVERLQARLQDLALSAGGKDTADLDLGGIVGELRATLAGWHGLAGRGSGSAQGAVAAQLNELVDQVGKLAFQIAMEVARLGAKGERLLPMTQSLEELTTDFRQTAARLAGEPEEPEADADAKDPGRLLQRVIAQLTEAASQSPAEAPLDVSQIAGIAGQVAARLAELAQSFNQQGDRLLRLGEAVAGLTGVEFDAGDSDRGSLTGPAPRGGILGLAEVDPFAPQISQPEPALEVDPFAGADMVLPGEAAAAETDFSTMVLPGREDTFRPFTLEPDPEPQPEAAAPPAVEPVAEPAAEPVADTNEFWLETTIPTAPPAGAVAEPDLPTEEERVYDLSDFGGALLPAEPQDADEERIYDLAEFGAVCLG